VKRALAPAKINPWLEVVGRRPDGYHDIRTWMLALDLCDRVDVQASGTDEIAIDVAGPFASADVPRDASNLCWRAASLALEFARASHDSGGAGARGGSRARDEAHSRARAEARDEVRAHERPPPRGVHIRLEKNIPSQSGLGGASSDAAATWIATLAALGVEAPASLAEPALASLGSDCVFFGKAASTGLGWCEGRGERVTVAAHPTAPWTVALLTPDVRCPTAAVYAAFRKPLRVSSERHSLPPNWFAMPATSVRRLFFNELEAVALDAIPALVPWRSALDACGAEHFRLSGSGSSFYGLFDNLDEAKITLDRVVGEARARGLHARGHWIARPAGFGAKLISLDERPSDSKPRSARESKDP
jgi:4-diphosphocytidyl-2-C-methyl-D-erythritol kinase